MLERDPAPWRCAACGDAVSRTNPSHTTYFCRCLYFHMAMIALTSFSL